MRYIISKSITVQTKKSESIGYRIFIRPNMMNDTRAFIFMNIRDKSQ